MNTKYTNKYAQVLSCIIVTIEKQYIEGDGGVFKLDPSKNTKDTMTYSLR